jgi:hypothetical protein
LAIWFGGLFFDGCDQSTGDLLEAKANIDFLFDDADNLKWWVNPEKDPALQMKAQSDAAVAAGRLVVWHAQTEKGYRGLNKIEEREEFPNLSADYDPN